MLARVALYQRASISALVAGAMLFIGCSHSSELRTARQSHTFVVAAVRGGDLTGWRLAGTASSTAARVWSERYALQDLGRRLRHEGRAWACEFAEISGELNKIGKFTVGDRRTVSETAKNSGANSAQIHAMLADVLKLFDSDLVEATVAVCQ
jgi:hypothetical protein